MKEIPLTRGKVALVDDADYEWLMQWKWHAAMQNANRFSAARRITAGGRRMVYMHRVIMGAPKGLLVDHKDGDPLHNFRSNLRLATKQQNAFNCGPRSNNTSGFKGVSWERRKKRWIAQIFVKRNNTYLGMYVTKEEAAVAYEEAAKKYHGEFARTQPFNAA